MFRKLLGLLTAAALAGAGAVVAIAAPAVAVQETRFFSYTGGVQQFVVPAGVQDIMVELDGASGGGSRYSFNDGAGGSGTGRISGGGAGGHTVSFLAVTPGEVLRIVVGGVGRSGDDGGAAGFNGGGSGVVNDGDSFQQGFAGGGGGATDIRQGGVQLTHRVAVAGGGGGAPASDPLLGESPTGRRNTGNGGGSSGDEGIESDGTEFPSDENIGGGGGTQIAGGAGGDACGLDSDGTSGSAGVGGNGAAGVQGAAGGGGGGGYFGGGGGGAVDCSGPPKFAGGGGGGSGFEPTGFGSTSFGDNFGNGRVRITYGTLPDAPSISRVMAGDGRATVQFDPPADPGGSPILDYTATCGSRSTTGAGTSLVVTGLTNDVTVACTVTARNGVGTGAASPQVPVTPGTLPGAPTTVTATAQKGGASIGFTPPSYVGPGQVFYVATCRNEDGGIGSNSSSISPIIVNLTPGSYTCTVRAHNEVGNGPESAPPVAVTPLSVTVPSAPTLLVLYPGSGVVESRATFPDDHGGDFPDSFTLTCVTTDGDAVQTFTASEDFTAVKLSGLPNGVVLRCTEHATNGVGDSPESNALTVTPVVSTVPGPVQNLVTTTGPDRVAFDFDPPASNGGVPIIGYFAFCDTSGGAGHSGAGSGAQPEPPLVIGFIGVPDPVCSVFAFNANGNSEPVVVTPSISPATVPGAPTGVSATGGNAQVTVQFTPPDDDGGSSVDGYVASCGDQRALGAQSPIIVRNLVNGVAVQCTVAAINNVGTGPSSFPPVSVTPNISGSVPGAPRNVAAARGNGQATVTFLAPTSDGGNPILDYTATCGPQSTTGAGSPLVVAGLTNGTTVSCTVTARNAIGTGPASSPPVSVKPATVPGAPLNVAATPGNTQATVTFAKPASNGGSGILDYTATCGTKSKTGTGSPLVVTGLTNGTAVNCTVKARNAVGTGPASAPPVSVRPATTPGAPVNVSASPANTQAIVKFAKPASNGGSAITSYTATCGSKSKTGSGSPLVVTNLVNGVTVNCTVKATNAIGTGPASSPPVAVTPRP